MEPTPLATGAVRALLKAGEHLSPKVRDRILGLGAAAIRPLIDLLQDDDLCDEDSAYADNTDTTFRASVSGVLASLDVKDERIFPILIRGSAVPIAGIVGLARGELIAGAEAA